MNSVIAAPRVRKGFLTGLCRAAAVLLLALTAWPETARAQFVGVPIIAVPITGIPNVGNTLTADTSAIIVDVGQSLRYQWYAVPEVVIKGATSKSYTIEEAQLGNHLKVKVGFYLGESLGLVFESRETAVVLAAGANHQPVGRPSFFNEAEWPDPATVRQGKNDLRVGDFLLAGGWNIVDPDGNGNLTAARADHRSYTWLADDVVVGPAVSAYTLKPAEAGKRITLRFTFTDSAGVVETVTSDAYGPVRWRVAATGQPTITGRYRVGDTLTAGTSEVNEPDGIDAASLGYQWLADDVAIANATGATYTLTGSEENKRIKVRVSFNDGAGDAETLTSAATGAVRAAGTQNRAVTGTVAISGAPRPGTTLRATPQVSDADGTTRSQFSYQWLADSAVISGATGTRYAVKDADVGKRISVRLTFTDDGGFVEMITSAQTETVRAGAAPTGRPGISGRHRVGDLLTAIIGDIGDPDGVDRTTFAYQWLANDAQISNATSKSYTLAAAQLGQRIKVRVTFTDGGGTQETVTSSATSAVVAAGTANQEPTGLPTISGTVRVDQTLTANTGGIADADGLTGVRYAYEWLVDDTAVSRGAGRAYTVTESDVGKRIKVRVTFTDDRGYVEILTSAETATVPAQASDGDVRLERDGRLFMYRNGAWGTVCDDGLSGMPGERLAQVVCRQLGRTGGTRLPYPSQVYYGPARVRFDRVSCAGTESRVGDCTFRYSTNIPCDHSEDVIISCTDETASRPSFPAPLQSVTISGKHRVGEVLTAHVTYFSETQDDVTSIAYQWFVDRLAVTGATATTYTVKASDQGSRIHVEVDVTFLNNDNIPTMLQQVSARTEPVLPLPTITGTALVGKTLTADTSGILDPDEPTVPVFTYQWLAGGEAISTATAKTYTVMTRDVGKRVAVQVSFTDEDGNEETLTSASTAEVAAGENTAAVTVGFRPVSPMPTAVEGGSGALVAVDVSPAPNGSLFIPITATGGGGAEAGDFTISQATLTFNSGETSKNVTVTAVDDAVDDDGETVTLGFGTLPSSASTVGALQTTITVGLTDNDERGVRVSKESMTVPEGGRGSYTVVLGSEPTAAVTVTVTTDLADTGLEVEPASLTFTGTSWTVAQTVTVIAAEDDNAVVEPVVTLAHAAAGGDYEGAEVAGVAVTVTENDTPALAIGDARGGEDAGVLEFVVSLSVASSKTVTVNYATADGTATAGSDYTGASGVLTFAPGVTDSQTIEVQITDDAADDEVEAETFTVGLSGAANATLQDATGTGTIDDDDDPAVTVAFGAASYTAAEGGSGATVVLSLSADPERTVEIPLTAAAGGDAAAGDYEVSAQAVTFAPGETAKHVTVTAVDDAVDDEGESVTLGFGALPPGVTAGSVTAAVVALEDNDERGVRVSKESMTVPEGGRGSYTVVLGSEPTAAVTVTVTTDLADTGLAVAPARLTFTGTSWSVAQTVTVIAAEDDNAVVEPVVTLAHAAAGGDYEGAEVAGVAVTVTENDTPALAIADARGGEDAGVLKFVVSLSVASSKAVTVNYATADGTATAGLDYTGASGVLTFAPGVTDSQTIEVQITDDAADDEVEAETFTVGLSGAANATLQDATGTGTIDDDDDPAVTVAFGAASYTAAEGGSGATVVLSLSADPERTVEIPLTAAAGGDAAAGDYEVSAQAVTFAPGETAKHVTVTAVDDAVDDEGESVTLGFGALPPGVTAGSVTAAVVALEDNDERGVRVSKESMTVPEGGRGSYTVVLGSEPTAAVTVTVTVTTDLADTGLEVEPASLTFTGTSWSVAQTVTVIAAEDDNAVVEPVVTLAHAAAGGDYEGAEVAGVAVTVTENDTPALAIADARGGEDAGVLKFVVSLSVASSKTVTVNYATADGTATAGSDYTGASGVLTFAPGVTDSQTIEVQITDDAADDEVEAETFTVGLSGAANATLQDATGTGTIDDDDDPAVTVAFGAASYTAAEGGSGATVVLSLSADPERTVEIPLTAAAGGDAAAGDYEVSAQAVTFAPGETAKHVTVTAVDDAVDDEGESVTLGFGALPPGVTAGSVTAAVVALEDNDERGVRVSKESMTVPEGGRGSYTVVLGSEPTAAVTVTVTADLADTGLEVEPASLTFTGTSWTVAQTVTVIAAEDDNAVVEPVVTLAHAAAGGDYEGAEVAGVAVTVVENDKATLAIGDARGREDAGVLKFVVSLSAASSNTVTVNYATADGTATAGSDYKGASGVLTFAPGVTDSQTIEVQIMDDAADDEVEAETFTVTLSGATNAELAVASATGTIEDDDDPAVTVAFGAASYTAAEGGGDAVVAVTLSADPERTVEIPLTAAAGGGAAAGDYTLSARTLTFESGATAREVRVTAVEDAVDDDGESVTLGFDALPAGVTAGSVTAAVVALEDNDERGVTVLPASLTVTEGGAAENYTVVLGSEPTGAVTVSVTTDLADTSVRVDPASLTFTAADWSTAQSVAVKAAEDEDALAEPVVTLEHVASGGDYSGAAVSGVAVTVVENDVPRLAVADATGAEGAGVLHFVVSLSAASSKTVTVNYATADGTATAGLDYTGASGVLTFAPGVTDSQTIEVQITDDAADDEVEAETFTVTLSGATNAELAVASATGTIEDDDDPAVTVAFGAASYRAAEGGGDAVVVVTLSADPERTVEIPLTAAAGGGAAAGDYRLSARTLTFESGATAREVTVTAVEDAVDDDGESVTLGFDALPAGVTAGSVTAAVVALEDNDERGVTVLPASLTVTEGGAAENYTVVLGSEPTAAVTVSVTTDLADTSVRVEPASLTFTAADWSTAQSVAVKAAEDEDALAEPVVTLEHVASGGDYSGAAVSGVAVTVVENDVPRLAVADATGAEGAGVLHFVVSLSVASSKTVTVGYATVDGTAVAGADYEPVSGRLTFTPGSAGSRTIEVSITDDAEAEDAETFTVELSGETNAVLGQASATGTIVDDDALNTPPAAVGVIEEQELTVGGEAARVDVSNAFADAEGDRLTYTAETADAEVATVRVAGTTVTVVPAGIGRTTVTVTASDSNAEATQRFVVVVGVVVGDAAVRPTADGGAVVVLTVPEAPTVRIEVPGGSEALDTDGDGDVDGQDELPTVRAVSSAAVPAVPEALRVRVDTGSAVDIEVPEQLTANGARVRVCLATSLDSERLALYRYDAEAQEWQRLESAVEQRGEQRFVCAEVGDFSVFAVFEERADVPGADVNGDERIDGDDALVMYYAYTSSSLLGDGETGGVGRFRRALLAGRAGNPNPSDADLMEMLRRANAWRGAGADAGGDVNEDGRIDGDDALVMYYAYTSSSLLGDGETGGVGRFRQTLLAGRAGSANPSDADLMKMLRRANDLTERLR